MNGQRVGYTRVSTLEQKSDRQLDGVDVDRTSTDHVSGKDLHRPELAAMRLFAFEHPALPSGAQWYAKIRPWLRSWTRRSSPELFVVVDPEHPVVRASP